MKKKYIAVNIHVFVEKTTFGQIKVYGRIGAKYFMLTIELVNFSDFVV
jgi:hypothetical protein